MRDRGIARVKPNTFGGKAIDNGSLEDNCLYAGFEDARHRFAGSEDGSHDSTILVKSRYGGWWGKKGLSIKVNDGVDGGKFAGASNRADVRNGETELK